MDEQCIRCFQAVAETNSFTKAAKKMYMTQPAVSAQIAKLERECQAKLFVRKYHDIQLSEIGRRLQPIFSRIIHDYDDLNRGLSDYLQQSAQQELRIGMYFSETLAGVLDQVTVFSKLHPEIHVVINNYPDILHELEQGTIDIGLEMILPNQQLDFQSCVLDEFVVLRGDQFVKDDQTAINLASLQSSKLYTLHSEGNTGGMKKVRDQLLGTMHVEQVVEFNSLESLLINLRGNDAFTVMPYAILPATLPRIAALHITNPRVSAKFQVGWGYQKNSIKGSSKGVKGGDKMQVYGGLKM